MEKIASFTVNHLTLEPGVYVSRVDADPATGRQSGQAQSGFAPHALWDPCRTRIPKPRPKPPQPASPGELGEPTPGRGPGPTPIEAPGVAHPTLRNSPEWRDRVVYFGPMGCRTGFYLILFGEHTSAEVAPLVRATFEFVRDFAGEIPGARPRSVATGTTPTSLRPSGGPAATWRTRSST